MIKRLALQFPKWVISGAIIFVSTGLFGFWWFLGKSTEPSKVREGARITKDSAGSSSPESQSAVQSEHLELQDKLLLLGDSSLFEFSDGKLELLQQDWLKSAPGAHDEPVFLAKENLLIIGRANHSVSIYLPSGREVGTLSLRDGSKFDGYLANDFQTAIFVKDGDIWKGQIEWKSAKVVGETQVTNLGYFLGNPFKGRLLGAANSALVYRDPRLGLVAVKLDTGETVQIQVPGNASPSPDGRLIVADTPTRPAQFVAFDLNRYESFTCPIPWRIPQNGLAWIDENRAVLTLLNEIMLFDNSDQTIESLYKTNNSSSSLALVAAPVSGEPFILFQDPNRGIIHLNVDSKEYNLVIGPPASAIQLLKNGLFLLVSDVPNSEQRGSWLGEFGSDKLQRVFAQPVVSQNANGTRNGVSAFSLPGSSFVYIRALNTHYLLNTVSAELKELTSITEGLRLIRSQ